MKVLWVIASPIGNIKSILFNESTAYTSGHWVDYTMENLTNYDSTIELGVLTTSNISEPIKKEKNNISYYCLNAGKSIVGKKFNVKHRSKVVNVINDFKPDLIQVWGTETAIGLLVREAAPTVPMVVVFQGVMNAIAKYPNGGLNLKELSNYNLLDKLKLPFFNKINKMYKKQAKIEQELVSKVDHVISESEWAFSFARAMNKTINTYWFPLQLNSIFYQQKRDYGEVKEHSIYTVSGRGAHKGLHNIIIAIGILKERYPSIKLYIPGNSKVNNRNIKNTLLKTPYDSYLEKLIKKYDLQENIIFTGVLSPKEVVSYLEKAHVFVMPSSIENQSASLREALAMEVPSISANVGCVDEVIVQKETGLLYRYEEYEVLANYISILFDNPKFAKKLGKNGKKYMEEKYYQKNGSKIMHGIYKEIIQN